MPDPSPAITICYPYALRMDGLAKTDAKLRQLYDEYKATIDSVTDEDYKNENLKKRFEDIYKTFIDYYRKENKTIDKLFDSDITLSIVGNVSRFSNTSKSIDVYMSVIQNGTEVKFKDNNPIISVINRNYNTIRKCFTYFSHLTEKWKTNNWNLNEIVIEINNNEQWIPPNIYGK